MAKIKRKPFGKTDDIPEKPVYGNNYYVDKAGTYMGEIIDVWNTAMAPADSYDDILNKKTRSHAIGFSFKVLRDINNSVDATQVDKTFRLVWRFKSEKTQIAYQQWCIHGLNVGFNREDALFSDSHMNLDVFLGRRAVIPVEKKVSESPDKNGDIRTYYNANMLLAGGPSWRYNEPEKNTEYGEIHLVENDDQSDKHYEIAQERAHKKKTDAANATPQRQKSPSPDNWASPQSSDDDDLPF